MSGRDHVGATNLFAGWQAACLQLRFERVRGEKLIGFAAVIFVYDATVRPILFNVSSMIFCGEGMVVVCDRIKGIFHSTSARAERTFAEKIPSSFRISVSSGHNCRIVTSMFIFAFPVRLHLFWA